MPGVLLTKETRFKGNPQLALKAARDRGAYLRRDFLDSPEWDRLAKLRGIRLPQWHVPAKPGGLRKYLKLFGIPVTEYLEQQNEKNLAEFQKLNPDWPLRAFVGMLLENWARDSGIWAEDIESEVE